MSREPNMQKFREFCARISEVKALKQKINYNAWKYCALDSKIAAFQRSFLQLFNILRERGQAQELPSWITFIFVLDPLVEEKQFRELKDNHPVNESC